MEALRLAGIEFEAVPGITAALGAAASVRISLTDRRPALKIVFLNNHLCAEKTLLIRRMSSPTIGPHAGP
jgi:siroheme synthase